VINKMELLTNATVVNDAMRFVSEQGKEKLISKGNDNGDGESKQEQDYNDNKKDTEKQGEEKQEEQSEEITAIIVF